MVEQHYRSSLDILIHTFALKLESESGRSMAGSGIYDSKLVSIQ